MTLHPGNFEQSMAHETRRRIATVMADGRWRTVADIMRLVKAERGSLAFQLGAMARMGILEQERRSQIYLFRKAPQTAPHSASSLSGTPTSEKSPDPIQRPAKRGKTAKESA